jgi:hypothetical protein
MKRVNILKVLSNKSWGLSVKNLNQVYNSLIRSLLEYSSIIYPCFSVTNLSLLERIQFKCLKIINRKSKFCSNNEIKDTPNYISIKDRFDELNLSYIRKNIMSNNEVLIDLINEYWSYSESRELSKRTLFCKYRNELRTIKK